LSSLSAKTAKKRYRQNVFAEMHDKLYGVLVVMPFTDSASSYMLKSPITAILKVNAY